MTDMETIIAAKIEAVTALAAALSSRIDADVITDIDDVQSFLAAWTEGVASLIPAVVGSLSGVQNFLDAWTAGVNAMVPMEDEGDGEPPINSVVSDKDGDFWTRCQNGLWASGQQSSAQGTMTWAELQKWGPLTTVV